MRLLGRGWQQSLIGAYEKPPAMPEDIYFARSPAAQIDLRAALIAILLSPYLSTLFIN